MTWFGWVYIGVLVFGTVTTVLTVGTERRPLRADIAAINVVLTGLMIAGALFVGTGSIDG